jgi:hypothetical protein
MISRKVECELWVIKPRDFGANSRGEKITQAREQNQIFLGWILTVGGLGEPGYGQSRLSARLFHASVQSLQDSIKLRSIRGSATQVPGLPTPVTSSTWRYLRVIKILMIYHHTC